MPMVLEKEQVPTKPYEVRAYIRRILGVYWGYIGIMEKKVETTV